MPILHYTSPTDNKNSGQALAWQILAEKSNPSADIGYFGLPSA